jgi:AraC-like DNA-binding protein
MNATPQAMSRTAESTASCVLTWPAVAQALMRGIPAQDVTRPAGLRLSQLADGRVRVPLRALHAVWGVATERLAEPHLGLAALTVLDSQGSWPEPFSLYENLFRVSETLGAGIERMARYARILRDGFGGHVEERGATSLVCFEFGEGEPWSLVELHVGMCMLLQRRVLPGRSVVREVWFKRPAPVSRRLFDQVFGVPIRFGAMQDGLLLDTEALQERLPGANAGTALTLEWRADALLQTLPDIACVGDRVRDAVLQGLTEGDVRVERIAKKLALSPRTLHRRLQAEGDSFQGVLDRTRCELAKRDLASGRFTVGEVSRRVGFTSVSAFSRAFKLWTDCTPVSYQQRASFDVGSLGWSGEAAVLSHQAVRFERLES